MQLWKKMKKNRKGFTLVEIIVVLVILAILAAFTIPAMLGYVNEARGKAYLAEAREIYTSYQAATTEVGAGNATVNTTINGTCNATVSQAEESKGKITATDTGAADVEKAINAKAIPYMSTDLQGTAYKVTIASSKVSKVEYLAGGYKITLNAGGDSKVEQTEATSL